MPDFRKIEHGALELDLTDVKLRDLVEGVIEMASLIAPKRTVDVLCDVSDDVPPFVRVDPTRLRYGSLCSVVLLYPIAR